VRPQLLLADSASDSDSPALPVAGPSHPPLLTLGRGKRKYNYINRSRKQPPIESNVQKRRATLAAVPDMSAEVCCARRRCFWYTDGNYLRAQKASILKMNRMERKRALTNMLVGNDFWFNSRIVCTVFLIKAFGFSRQLQAAVKQLPCAAASSSITVVPRLTGGRSQRTFVLSFLEHAAEFNSDKMPNAVEVHLPYFRKIDVYMAFRDQFSERGPSNELLQPASFSYFSRIWSSGR